MEDQVVSEKPLNNNSWDGYPRSDDSQAIVTSNSKDGEKHKNLTKIPEFTRNFLSRSRPAAKTEAKSSNVSCNTSENKNRSKLPRKVKWTVNSIADPWNVTRTLKWDWFRGCRTTGLRVRWRKIFKTFAIAHCHCVPDVALCNEYGHNGLAFVAKTQFLGKIGKNCEVRQKTEKFGTTGSL